MCLSGALTDRHAERIWLVGNSRDAPSAYVSLVGGGSPVACRPIACTPIC